ncbi:MAG TPA: hypothetical protein VG097_11445 [Gemmata sp.]|nr:hypothetical protein [Gemmata sp.]
MFIPVACSQCGKPFQVPETALGKPTACPWCHASVLALPLSGETSADPSPATSTQATGTDSNAAAGVEKSESVPHPEHSQSKTLPPPEPLSLDDDPPPIQIEQSRPRPAKSLLRRIFWILLGLFLMSATTVITLGVLQQKQGHIISLEWQAFTAPDGSCEIDLLGQAVETDSDPEHGERRYVSKGWYSGTSTWISWRNLTPVQVQEGTTKDGWVQYRKLFFDTERDRLIGKFGGYIARDATIDHEPKTVEVRLDGQNGAVIERMIVRGKGERPRIYFIGMAGKRLNLDGPDVKRLFDSFQVYEN